MSEAPGVNFDTRVPADSSTIASNIRHTLSLGLRDADDEPLETLTVIANGPSALDWPGWTDRNAASERPTLALNGALKLFAERGMAPSFWAACDPQALVANFLTDAPRSTQYLVASKCHADVFDALAGRDVRLWHVDEDGTPPGLRTVQPSSSITGTALALMRALGWRKFEVWGWDACFINGLDHAAPQPIAPINVVTVVLGEGPDAKGFHTTPTWAHEAEGAWKRLWGADYQVDVRGPGLIAEMLRFQGVTKQTEGLAA